MTEFMSFTLPTVPAFHFFYIYLFIVSACLSPTLSSKWKHFFSTINRDMYVKVFNRQYNLAQTWHDYKHVNLRQQRVTDEHDEAVL